MRLGRSTPAQRTRATPLWPDIRECSWQAAREKERSVVGPGSAGARPPVRQEVHDSAGLIALHASIRLRTDATDFANIAVSASSSAISTIRSTPFAPITT